MDIEEKHDAPNAEKQSTDSIKVAEKKGVPTASARKGDKKNSEPYHKISKAKMEQMEALLNTLDEEDHAILEHLYGDDRLDDITYNMKEQFDEMFGEDETLTPEFKNTAYSIMELAVKTRVKSEMATMEEEFENSMVEETNKIIEGVSKFLTKTSDQWTESNKQAIESSIKLQQSESFMAGLKDLLETHYVEIPEDKADILEDAFAEIDDLRNELNEKTKECIEVNEDYILALKYITVNEISEEKDLSDVQTAKLKEISENVDFVDDDAFKATLLSLSELYTGKVKTNKVSDKFAGLSLYENKDEDLDEEVKPVVLDPIMEATMKTLNRMNKHNPIKTS